MLKRLLVATGHPDEHGAREHALEKLIVAEQAINAALADPERYDAQMIQVRLCCCYWRAFESSSCLFFAS